MTAFATPHIVGCATVAPSKAPARPALAVAQRAIDGALADAGLDRTALGGLAVTPPGLAGRNTAMFVSRLGAYLGLPLGSLACLENGGMSAALALKWATMEVALGHVDVAVACGIDQRLPEFPADEEPMAAFLERVVDSTMAVYGPYDGPYGLGAPIPYYAMSAQRYMHETGASRDDLSWAAIRLREHAQQNPEAVFRGKPLASPDDVTASPVLSPPLHLNDCSQFTSGCAAVVVARPEVARDLGRASARLRGWGQHHHPSAFAQGTPSICRFPSVERAATEAYAAAGIAATDVDVAEIYGVFSATELMLVEALGWAERGQAGAAFRDGALSSGGARVVDPTGGRLSLGHPATATPLYAMAEIARQLAGRAEARQVPGAALGLVHAEHGMLNGSMVAIWEAAV